MLHLRIVIFQILFVFGNTDTDVKLSSYLIIKADYGFEPDEQSLLSQCDRCKIFPQKCEDIVDILENCDQCRYHITDPPSLLGEIVTVCCQEDEKQTVLASGLLPYLNNTYTQRLVTIGCNFFEDEDEFLALNELKSLKIKTPEDKVVFKVDFEKVSEDVKAWEDEHITTNHRERELHADTKIFAETEEQNLKAFSYIDRSGEIDTIKTVVYRKSDVFTATP